MWTSCCCYFLFDWFRYNYYKIYDPPIVVLCSKFLNSENVTQTFHFECHAIPEREANQAPRWARSHMCTYVTVLKMETNSLPSLHPAPEIASSPEEKRARRARSRVNQKKKRVPGWHLKKFESG